jgi:FkbM family methyltransferase
MQAIHQSLNELREGTLDAQMQAIRQSLDELRQDYLRLANDCAASNSQMAQRHDALRQDLANHPRRYGQLVDDNVVLVEHPLGWVFGIPAENWAVVQLYTHETGFERGTINVLSSLCQKGMTVVDIGAHVGLHSLILASRAGKEGRIHCFEPCARSCKILRRNLFINGFSNVNVHQVALSDRNGISTFFEFNEELTWSSLYPPAGLESCTQVRVETACLDEVLPEDVKVDLVKLDAEGAELDILRGMKRIIARSPRIQIIVEFGPSNIVRAGNRPEDLLQLIREFGFSMQCIDEATGQLSPAKIDELPSVQSVNLLLSRPESA